MNSITSFYKPNVFNTSAVTSSTLSNSLPVTTNLRFWLDADDPYRNRTKPIGDTDLATWLDKSTYNLTASAVTGASTATTMQWQSSGFNSSYPCFNFQGRSAFKRFVGQFTGGSAITGTNAMYVFVVATQNSTEVGGGATSEFAARFIAMSQNNLGIDYDLDTCWGFLRQSGTGMGPYRHAVYLANNPSSYNVPTVWQAGFTGTQSKASFLNGNSTVTNSASNTMGNFNINYYAIGGATAYTDGPSYLTGKMSEILIYSGTLTATQIAQIEGYLA